ncbi:hypothetical protein GUJ93_ZPchr0007g4739 [Zizania palustris]|uniref:Uncharacterized protein n=1 Tax=Zizania palustris TaxID=103762 RepID=A0A8J5VNW9_ZIZPA|nr:hypothetical protein GUJ93_ZPchr0007g4739 [Zizania palustris]
MAAADDHLDDDEFDEYNPHPYSGGYDIFATYGSPLPPSPSTCYAISTTPTAPTQPLIPAPAPPLQPSPAQPRSASPEPPRPPPTPVAEPYYWPKPYDYGDAARDQPMYATPEVFRGWPYLLGPQCCSQCGRDYWRQCMRGLDYLFGHSHGYGERRIGLDFHGVPVYANRKGGVENAVVIEVQPPATGTVQWHHAGEGPDYSGDNQFTWDDNAKDETHAYVQPTYEQSYSTDVVSDEITWLPNQNYMHAYKEESQYQEILSSGYTENKISSQPIYCYNQQFGEQPLHVQVEPPETLYSHKLEYYESFSTYSNHNSTDNLDMLGHSYDIQPDEHVPDEPLDPMKPSWSMNSVYYQSCTDGTPAEFENHTLSSSEFGDLASLFATSFYPQQTQLYEQYHGDSQTVSIKGVRVCMFTNIKHLNFSHPIL